MSDKAKTAHTGLLLDDYFEKHLTGPEHPERPARVTAIVHRLKESGLAEKLPPIEMRDVTDAEVLQCHKAEYLKLVKDEIPKVIGLASLSTGDTTVCPESLDVARKAAGGVLNAVDFVFAKGESKTKRRNAFCAIRPPGHHATPSVGMGFCIFNNAAIAARYAQRKHGVKRVAIIDWDVHHGNGTQDIFYADGSVYYFSTHQSPLYPYTGPADETGDGEGKGATLNCPFPAGAAMEQVGGAFDEKFLPAMEKFKPELVIISAGFDSRVDDPLGGFKLTDDDFVSLTDKLLKLADEHSGGRLVSVLEGGYNVDGLASAVEAHLGALSA